MPMTYCGPYTAQSKPLDQVLGPVYALTPGLTRAMVIDTSEGIAVLDNFDAEFAGSMKQALAHRFPGKPVKWLAYSHNHLDHVRGSLGLGAQEVIALGFNQMFVPRFGRHWGGTYLNY